MATNLNLECGALEFQTLLLNRDNDPRKLDSPSAGWSRPSNPIVKREITTLGGWIPMLALASYDPRILL